MAITLNPSAWYLPLVQGPASMMSGFLQSYGQARQNAAAQEAAMQAQADAQSRASWNHLIGTGLSAGVGAGLGGMGLLGTGVGAGGGALLGGALGYGGGAGAMAGAAIGNQYNRDEMATRQAFAAQQQQEAQAHDIQMQGNMFAQQRDMRNLDFQNEYGMTGDQMASFGQSLYAGSPEQAAASLGMTTQQIQAMPPDQQQGVFRALGMGGVQMQRGMQAVQLAGMRAQAIESEQQIAQMIPAIQQGQVQITDPTLQRSFAEATNALNTAGVSRVPAPISAGWTNQAQSDLNNVVRQVMRTGSYKPVQDTQAKANSMMFKGPDGRMRMMVPQGFKVQEFEDAPQQTPKTWADIQSSGMGGEITLQDGTRVLWNKEKDGSYSYFNPPKSDNANAIKMPPGVAGPNIPFEHPIAGPSVITPDGKFHQLKPKETAKTDKDTTADDILKTAATIFKGQTTPNVSQALEQAKQFVEGSKKGLETFDDIQNMVNYSVNRGDFENANKTIAYYEGAGARLNKFQADNLRSTVNKAQESRTRQQQAQDTAGQAQIQNQFLSRVQQMDVPTLEASLNDIRGFFGNQIPPDLIPLVLAMDERRRALQNAAGKP